MLWANGAVDRQVPTAVNAEILRSLHHSNWDIEILAGVTTGYSRMRAVSSRTKRKRPSWRPVFGT
jgi:hypothetical protein